MIARGWTPEEALAAAGNVNVESGFNPAAVNKGGGDTGLVQWTGPRKAALKSFATATGRDWTDPEAQMDWLHMERTGESARWGGGNEQRGFTKAFAGGGTPADMAHRFGQFVERPAKLAATVADRTSGAAAYAQQLASGFGQQSALQNPAAVQQMLQLLIGKT